MADVAKRVVQAASGSGTPGVAVMTSANSAAQNLYPCPAGGSILRSIHICNITTSVVTFNLAITQAVYAGATNGAEVATNCFMYQVPVSPGQPFDWSGFISMASGDILRGQASGSSSLTITVSAVEL